MSAVNNALAFAALGHSVLPIFGTKEVAGDSGTTHICACPKGAACTSPGKHPLASLVPNGLKDATTDAEKITAWADAAPGCNWAVVTGKLVVLDQDGPKGRASLGRLQKQHRQLPATWTVSTGRLESRHFYFRCPPGAVLVNSAGKLGKGLDIRAAGGYCVIPGSRHISGHVYAWWERNHPRDGEAALLPKWLINLISGTRTNGARPSKYYQKRAAEPVPEGERNCRLAELAGHFLANYVDPFVVLETLQGWNLGRCKPPLSRAEVETVVASITEREFKKRILIP